MSLLLDNWCSTVNIYFKTFNVNPGTTAEALFDPRASFNAHCTVSSGLVVTLAECCYLSWIAEPQNRSVALRISLLYCVPADRNRKTRPSSSEASILGFPFPV